MGKTAIRSRVLTIIFAISLMMASATFLQSIKAWDEYYAMDTDLKYDIPLYTPVTATAWTIDKDFESVTFRWRDPDGHLDKEETIALTGYTAPNAPPNAPESLMDWIAHLPVGTKYWVAQSTHSPDEVGKWHVTAIFYESTSECHCDCDFDIIWRSFFVIPEVPLGLFLGLFGALGIFILKSKNLPITKL